MSAAPDSSIIATIYERHCHEACKTQRFTNA